MAKGTPDSHEPSDPGSQDTADGIGAIVRKHRQAMGLTLQVLADRVGCAKSYLSAIENDRRPGPPGDNLLAALESALAIPKGQLVEAARWQATPETVRAQVQQMRAALRAAAGVGGVGGAGGGGESGTVGGLDQAFKSGALHRLVGAAPAAPAQSARLPLVQLPHEIPLINKVAAGYPRDFTDLGYPARVADEYIRCPDLSPGGADADAFAARVIGDSMAPTYLEGDIVVFSPARPVQPGMDCFARLEPDHETTFKRIYFETATDGAQLIRLQPLNSAYPPRTLPREQVAGLYAAVSVMRRV